MLAADRDRAGSALSLVAVAVGIHRTWDHAVVAVEHDSCCVNSKEVPNA